MVPLTLREAACGYALSGWAVLPLLPASKRPAGALVPHGMEDATTDPGTVLGWWTLAPHSNIGINCGASGLVAIDVDPRHGGDDALHELEGLLGALPQTVEAHSGGGGRHLLWSHPGGVLAGVLAPGVDIKDRGYIVAPPSVHPESRRRYVWSVDGDPFEGDAVLPLPAAWVEAMRPVSAIRRDASPVRTDSDDPLRRIPAADYIPRLTGRPVNADGFVQCPWHRGGEERTPSLRVSGTLWACYGCSAPAGKRVMGGNIYDLGALLRGYALPLRGGDFLTTQAWLRGELL